jgi:hypothetical protein
MKRKKTKARWQTYTLFINPEKAMKDLQAYLRQRKAKTK